MGIYINPENETKEAFLLREAKEISSPTQYVDEDKIQICLVDNGIFTAAGVLYSQREIDAFSRPNDMRPKRFFLIERAKLSGVIPPQDLQFVLNSK